MSAFPTRAQVSAAFTIFFWLAVAGGAVYTLFFASRSTPVNQGIVLRNYRMIDDFSLLDQYGQTRRRQDFAGKVWVVDFIFTSCTAECLVLSERMAELQRRFAGNPEVAFVSLSVDPQTDTPQRLAQYATRYQAGPHWTFLTGDTRTVDQLIKGSFLLPVARDDRERSQIYLANLIHSQRFAVVDRLGVVRFYAEGMEPEALDSLTTAIERLLAEPGATLPAP